MAKEKNIYFCTECGNESAKWMGQCPVCKAWNTLVEEPKAPRKAKIKSNDSKVEHIGIRSGDKNPVYIADINLEDKDRYDTGYEEFNRVLGGGIVAGSLVLVGGDPGIGKSTILLQLCKNLAAAQRKVLYISGEESLKQIRMRADRLGEISGELKILCETNLSDIEAVIWAEAPEIVIIDSIQTMFREDVSSAAGSVSQVRESTNTLLQIAKGAGISIFIVGHVTKDGQVAGPRVLEHMVDTVLYFEGERSASYRILRAVKNRFGSTNEIGVFEMRNEGLAEVKNPSEFMLSGRPLGASGCAVACPFEGTRPILLEVQALVTETAFGMPRRTAAGTDYNRVNLLLAVIEKYCRIPMSRYDAYINIAGGIKMNEPALDLAIIMSLVSSVKNRSIDDKTVIFGEVGLSGEVRAVNMVDLRVREAKKLGFHTIILPKVSLDKLPKISDIHLVGVSNIREAIDYI